LHSNLIQEFLSRLTSHIQIPGSNLGPAVVYLDSDLYRFSSVSLRKYRYRYRNSVHAMIFSFHKILKIRRLPCSTNCWQHNYIKLVTLFLKAYAHIEVCTFILNLTLDSGQWLASRLRRLISEEKNPQYQLLRRLGGAGLEGLGTSDVCYRWRQWSGWIERVEVTRASRYGAVG
jgi:hypothetical protein